MLELSENIIGSAQPASTVSRSGFGKGVAHLPQQSHSQEMAKYRHNGRQSDVSFTDCHIMLLCKAQEPAARVTYYCQGIHRASGISFNSQLFSPEEEK